MRIDGNGAPSLFLGHQIIPVGAKLTIQTDLYVPRIETLLPASHGNLRNLSNFTKIHLDFGGLHPRIQPRGPNGEVSMVPVTPEISTTCSVLGSLAQFDTSKTERLKIDCGYSTSSDLLYRTLLPMKRLRSLTLSRYTDPGIFVHALKPGMMSSLEVVVCPKLEELVLVLRVYGEILNIKNVIKMVAARALRGAKLKTVRIVIHDEAMQIDALELSKHALCVECGPEVNIAEESGDDDDDE
jgi:hypothetical protein